MRLRRSDTRAPGIRRVRRGRGFSYETDDGSPIEPEDRTRITGLVIPPAWRQVWICPYPNGHIQATGVDVAGRKQYLYHDQWRRERDEEKHDRVLAMGAGLEPFRAGVAADLAMRGLCRRRVEAVALRLLDRGVFRVGGEEYAEENGTRGVATLLRQHVDISGDRITFDYPAKGSIRRTVTVVDADLVKACRSLLRSKHGSDRFLVYREGNRWHQLHSDDVNARFKELAGEGCTAKDLRTWHATVLAAAGYACAEEPISKRAITRARKQVLATVAEALGNTPTVARNSYVDPRVEEAYIERITVHSALIRARRASSADEQRDIVEKSVVRLLRRMSNQSSQSRAVAA